MNRGLWILLVMFVGAGLLIKRTPPTVNSAIEQRPANMSAVVAPVKNVTPPPFPQQHPVQVLSKDEFVQKFDAYSKLMQKVLKKPADKAALRAYLKDKTFLISVVSDLTTKDLSLNERQLRIRFNMVSFLVRAASESLGAEHDQFLQTQLKEYISAEPISAVRSDRTKLTYFHGDKVELLMYLSKTRPDFYDALKFEADPKNQLYFETAEQAAEHYQIAI